MGVQLHEDQYGVFAVDVTIASVGAANVGQQTYAAIPGLRAGDFAQVSFAGVPPAGLGIGSVRVTAAGTLQVGWINPTAAPIVPGSTSILVYWFRAERAGINQPLV